MKIPIALTTGPGFSMSVMSEEELFEPLKSYLTKVPTISDISCGFSGDGYWWVKFTIDIEHPLAWSVVQGLGHVLNYVSLEERLPTVFMPVSPSPYMNGGPGDFLSWVIESKSKDFKPEKCAEWLEGRLPQPVTDIEQWAFLMNSDTSERRFGGHQAVSDFAVLSRMRIAADIIRYGFATNGEFSHNDAEHS